MLSGVTQGAADFLLRPDLSPQQRIGRVAIAAGLGVLIAAGVVGFGLEGAVAVGAVAVAGVATDWAKENVIFPSLGLGSP